MPFAPGSFLLLVFLGGVVAIDGTSFGQFMLSRPFVAATLAGWIVGDPVAGASIGLILEAFHLTVLPVGAARYPEGGPAAVVAGAVYAASGVTSAALLVIVLFTLMLEWVGGETVRYLRQLNVHLITVDYRTEMHARALETRHLAAVGVDFGRGVLLVAGGIVVLSVISRWLIPYWGLGEMLTRLLLIAMISGLLASALRMVGWRAWFAAAGALGATVVILAT